MTATEKANRYTEISRKYGDPWIWGIYITLIIISIIESYSASSQQVTSMGVYEPIIKQCVHLLMGAVCLILISRTDYNRSRFLYIMIPGLALVTIVTLVYVFFAGDVVNGAQRVMQLPGFTLQPAELAKLSIVTLLSYILAKSQRNKDVSNGGIIASAIAVSIYGGLLIRSGLTNAVLLMCISLSMLVMGGAQFKKVGYLIIFYIVLAGGYGLIQSHNSKTDKQLNQAKTEMNIDTGEDSTPVVNRGEMREGRIKAWWNNDSLVYRPITDQNQQEMFSRMAQAHGGLPGCGIGKSRECSRLPLAFSDFIYSIIVEETGLVGGIFVLLLYLSLLGRAAMIVRRSKRVLPSLLVIGMASFITYQALFHMAINVGVFPVSGQTLPLISKGGTSIIVISIAFGVMLSVSRTIANYNNKDTKVDNTEIIDGLDAENPIELPKNIWK